MTSGRAASRVHQDCILLVTLQTDVTFPFADQSHGWKCDMYREKYMYPIEGPVSTYPYIHNTTNRAHIERTFFYFWLLDGYISAPSCSTSLLRCCLDPTTTLPEIVNVNY